MPVISHKTCTWIQPQVLMYSTLTFKEIALGQYKNTLLLQNLLHQSCKSGKIQRYKDTCDQENCCAIMRYCCITVLTSVFCVHYKNVAWNFNSAYLTLPSAYINLPRLVGGGITAPPQTCMLNCSTRMWLMKSGARLVYHYNVKRL